MNIWPDMVVHAIVMHLGMLIFFGTKTLAAHRYGSAGEPSITDYWKKHPTTTLMAFAGAYAGFLIALQFNQLNYVAALGIGFMADRIADSAAVKVKAKLEGGNDATPL